MKKCDLCDNPAMHIHAKCHITAPLRAEIVKYELSLICYQCGKLIVKFKLRDDETTVPIPQSN